MTQEGLQKGLAEDFEGLAASERGVLLALFACDGDQAILARLDERRRDSCVTAWEILRQLDERTRAEKLEGWRCQAASALPEGLARLHPSWIDDILDGEPEHIAREVRAILPSALRDVSRSDEATLVVGGGDASGQSDEAADEAAKRDLRRLLFVRLEPLCAGACGPRAQVLCGLTFEALLDEVARASHGDGWRAMGSRGGWRIDGGCFGGGAQGRFGCHRHGLAIRGSNRARAPAAHGSRRSQARASS